MFGVEARVGKILDLNDMVIPLNIIWLAYPKEEFEGIDRYDENKIPFVK